MDRRETLNLLNAESASERLENLKALLDAETQKPKPRPEFANNHIHSFYSFSPYSPTAAVWFARAEGLPTAGIMDHDSIAGGEEFIAAGALAGIGATCGLECRVSLKGTFLENRRVNNPDQSGVAYMALHGIPRARFRRAQEVFAPLRALRNARNRAMTGRLDALTAPCGVGLDFDRHVLPLSRFHEGGSVTERHILFALAGRILEAAPPGSAAEFVAERLGVELSPKQAALLGDTQNPYLQYDLLGVLKGGLTDKFYIPAGEECLSLPGAVGLAEELEAVLCYAYLGDVGESPTGDKKAAKFEDDYLEDLFDLLVEAGVPGVTFMPSRNTAAQLDRLMALCAHRGLRQISGEDVNSPRQSFICEELKDPRFSHLVRAARDLADREARALLQNTY